VFTPKALTKSLRIANKMNDGAKGKKRGPKYRIDGYRKKQKLPVAGQLLFKYMA